MLRRENMRSLPPNPPRACRKTSRRSRRILRARARGWRGELSSAGTGLLSHGRTFPHPVRRGKTRRSGHPDRHLPSTRGTKGATPITTTPPTTSRCPCLESTPLRTIAIAKQSTPMRERDGSHQEDGDEPWHQLLLSPLDVAARLGSGQRRELHPRKDCEQRTADSSERERTRLHRSSPLSRR